MNVPEHLFPSEPLIHVGIMASTELRFILKGSYSLNGKRVAQGEHLATNTQGMISCFGLTENQPIELLPESPGCTFVLKEVSIGIGFHWEQKEDQEFEGALRLQLENNKVRAVNVIALERYLISVISSEMSAMNDQNLLNAHAIVSRSWLLSQLAEKDEKDHFVSVSETRTNGILEITRWYDRENHDSFDVCADDHCQRYQGITKVISEKAKQAINQTRGQVLTYKGSICDARFSKCCGGQSEDFENVWQPVNVPYLRSIPDNQNFSKVLNFRKVGAFRKVSHSEEAFCNTNDAEVLRQVLINYDQETSNFFSWIVEYDQETLSSLIEKKSGLQFGRIIEMQPLERGKSGRMIRLKIVGEKQTVIVGKELEIRKWLSETHLYSAAFTIEKIMSPNEMVPKKFIFHGSGWGHGVGMCQIGAAVMSQKGYPAKEILSHYFKGTTIKKAYR